MTEMWDEPEELVYYKQPSSDKDAGHPLSPHVVKPICLGD